MMIKACPKCGSKNIILDTAGHTGKYKCLDCGYLGPIIVESEDKLKCHSFKKST